MKRLVLMVTVALVMALMMALAGPALATIHPLANSECASDNPNSQGVANNQTPPGLTPGGPDQSKATVAQPVIAAGGEDLSSPALKTPVVFPEPNFCPANK